jgi:recombination protein RecT
LTLSIVDAAYNEVNARSTSIEKLLPPHMKLERFMMQVKIAIYKVPKLAECDRKSLTKSFLECAELGLDPTFRLGSACIVPFSGVATLIIGYRGMIDLATRSGEVKTANAWVVHERDLFKPRNGSLPTHVPYVPRPEEEQNPGQPYAAWARYTVRGGISEATIMTKREIDAVMAKAPAVRMKQRTPWTDDPFSTEEMWKKTALKRNLKNAPLSPERAQYLARAIEIEDAQEAEWRATDAEAETEAAPKKSRTQAVAEDLGMTDEEKAEAVRRENEQAKQQ